MTLPRSRAVQAVILLLTCGAMAAFPLTNHFRLGAEENARTAWFADEVAGRPVSAENSQFGHNKDYPLWYATGRAFMAGEEYYPPTPGVVFPFMYPPFAGLLLGLLSELGPDGMLLVLVLLNVLSVAVVVELGVRLVAGTGDVSLWLRLIPGAVCLFFLYDMFLLGQPNLGLLCLVLSGLMLVRTGKGVAGGGLLAAAAAIKAFPATAVVYLLWRRHWAAAASMVAFTALFLVPLPATVRGWDRSVTELKRWADGMLFKSDESGFGQRPEQSLGWKNQSLFGVGHRLLRRVNVYSDELIVPKEEYKRTLPMSPEQAAALDALPDPTPRELYVNLLALTHKQATLGILAAAGLMGLVFVLVMPARAARTRSSDALELGVLVMLVLVCTPYAYSYYSVWLIYPLTVLVHRGLSGPTALDRRVGWGATAAVAVFFALSAPLTESRATMGLGVMFWAAVSAAIGCGWLLAASRDAPRAAGSD